jgi:hypothetical protein
MPMADYKDIVRGLGFTTLYAAYMEEAVDECRIVLMNRDPAPPEGIKKWPTSRRVEYVRDRLAHFEPLPHELAELPRHLDHVSDLLERRSTRSSTVGSMAAFRARRMSCARAGRLGARDRSSPPNSTTSPTRSSRR